MSQVQEQVQVVLHTTIPVVHCIECGEVLDTVQAVDRYQLANDPTCDDCHARWQAMIDEHENWAMYEPIPYSDRDSELERWYMTQAGVGWIRQLPE